MDVSEFSRHALDRALAIAKGTGASGNSTARRAGSAAAVRAVSRAQRTADARRNGPADVTYAGQRLIQSLLFGVSPSDQWSLLSGAVILSAVGVCASLIPAGQATRINPIAALRHE